MNFKTSSSISVQYFTFILIGKFIICEIILKENMTKNKRKMHIYHPSQIATTVFMLLWFKLDLDFINFYSGDIIKPTNTSEFSGIHHLDKSRQLGNKNKSSTLLRSHI